MTRNSKQALEIHHWIIEVDPKLSLSKGAFILSIDTEMAWGFVHLPQRLHPNDQFQRSREVVDRLLRLLERYEIKATWAVVGHLLLESCERLAGVKHPEIVRPQYSWLPRDWFEPDPCNNVKDSPFWYGPDIVDAIVKCKIPQEIGSHTFSHVFASDAGCSSECFQSELEACKGLAETRELKLKSLVYPKNRVGHTTSLREKGFLCYRGPDPCWYGRFTSLLWRISHKIDSFGPIPPAVVLPEKTDGVWNIPGSYYYPHRTGWGRVLPIWMRVWKAKVGLRRAAIKKAIFHLWFHPYNLATDMSGLFSGLEKIFAEVNRLRAKGLIENLTMGELAERLEKTSDKQPVVASKAV